MHLLHTISYANLRLIAQILITEHAHMAEVDLVDGYVDVDCSLKREVKLVKQVTV